MERKKGLAEELVAQGVRLAIEAAEKVLADPRGREALSVASELAQKALKKLEELPAAAARAAGVPGRDDYRDLAERVERIQKRAADLAARLDAIDKGERRPAGTHGEPSAKPRWHDPDDPDVR